MKLFKSIGSFTRKWRESWRTKPDFILDKKALSTQQVSGKYSFLNAFISGALGVRTLLSILVGVAGITSIVVYDIVLKPESPLFAVSSDLETENTDLLADISNLLSLQPEVIVEPVNTETAVDSAPENNAVTEDAVLEYGDDVIEISPETGDRDVIILIFLLMCTSFVLLRGLGTRILYPHGGSKL